MVHPGKRHLVPAFVFREFQSAEFTTRQPLRLAAAHTLSNVIANLAFDMKHHLGIHLALPFAASDPCQPIHATPIHLSREQAQSLRRDASNFLVPAPVEHVRSWSN